MTQRTLISLHPNKYIEVWGYYTFAFDLDTCMGSCNTHNNLSDKECLPNKTKNINLSDGNIITGRYEWILFSMEINIYTVNIKTKFTWHHDYYRCQGYKKSNN